MKRWGAALLALLLIGTLSACRARVDLTAEPLWPEELLDTVPEGEGNEEENGGEMDEMAAYAWELYSAAVEAEERIVSYDITYEGSSVMLGEITTTRARLVRVDCGDSCEMLIQTNEQQGYFKDGIGYFSTPTEKYWIPTDEEGFVQEMGFSESPSLGRSAFGSALVIENEDGTRTVSCPLSGEYAASYAAETLGLSDTRLTVERAEEGVTVDAEGAPLSFFSRLEVTVPYYGTVAAESSSTYTAVGDAVALTPPDDLDSYRQAEE